MKNNIEILEELKEITPSLVQIDRTNFYSVPFNYFSSLAEEIVKKIRTIEEPVFKFNKTNAFSIPESYFDKLASSVLQRIKATDEQSDVSKELAEVAPLLNTISKKPVYTVPAGYFETLQFINNKQVAKPDGKVVSFRATRVFKYAVAAAVTSILAIGGYLMVNKENGTELQAHNQVHKTEVNNLSDQDISDFLNASVTEDISSNTGKSANVEAEVKKSVSEMSDEEIKQYLQEIEGQEEI